MPIHSDPLQQPTHGSYISAHHHKPAAQSAPVVFCAILKQFPVSNAWPTLPSFAHPPAYLSHGWPWEKVSTVQVSTRIWPVYWLITWGCPQDPHCKVHAASLARFNNLKPKKGIWAIMNFLRHEASLLTPVKPSYPLPFVFLQCSWEAHQRDQTPSN